MKLEISLQVVQGIENGNGMSKRETLGMGLRGRQDANEALLGGWGTHVPCLNFASNYVGISQGSDVACRNFARGSRRSLDSSCNPPPMTSPSWILNFVN